MHESCDMTRRSATSQLDAVIPGGRSTEPPQTKLTSAPAWRRSTSRWVAGVLPSAMLVATLIDDPLFGGVIIASELAFGTVGLLTASIGFIVVSTVMAAATAWALRVRPIQLSVKNRRRIASLRQRRLGRFLVPHPNRPVTTAIGAIVFGSVAPIIVAALEPEAADAVSQGMVILSGVAYGIAFASAYGLLGALVGSVA